MSDIHKQFVKNSYHQLRDATNLNEYPENVS